eukprot:7381901-Prymnesium_polylepis.1
MVAPVRPECCCVLRDAHSPWRGGPVKRALQTGEELPSGLVHLQKPHTHAQCALSPRHRSVVWHHC